MEKLIETVVEQLLAEVRPGRAGWKDRARARLRAEVTQRAQEWASEARWQADREARRAAHVRRLAEWNDAAEIEMDAPHGASYFGSGGGWAKPPRLENIIPGRHADNGFICGPITWRVVDPSRSAEFSLVSGDDIGDGRTFHSGARWVPGEGWTKIRGAKW